MKYIEFMIDFLQNSLRKAFKVFSMIMFSLVIVGVFANVQAYGKGFAIKHVILFISFSLLYGILSCLCKYLKVNVILKRTIVFIATYLSFYVCFMTGNYFENFIADKQNPAFTFVALSFMFVIIYVICAFIVYIGRFIGGKIKNSNKHYDSMFENK